MRSPREWSKRGTGSPCPLVLRRGKRRSSYYGYSLGKARRSVLPATPPRKKRRQAPHPVRPSSGPACRWLLPSPCMRGSVEGILGEPECLGSLLPTGLILDNRSSPVPSVSLNIFN